MLFDSKLWAFPIYTMDLLRVTTSPSWKDGWIQLFCFVWFVFFCFLLLLLLCFIIYHQNKLRLSAEVQNRTMWLCPLGLSAPTCSAKHAAKQQHNNDITSLLQCCEFMCVWGGVIHTHTQSYAHTHAVIHTYTYPHAVIYTQTHVGIDKKVSSSPASTETSPAYLQNDPLEYIIIKSRYLNYSCIDVHFSLCSVDSDWSTAERCANGWAVFREAQ